LVSLGSAARNIDRIKVRQPLAEIKVQPGNEWERRAVERFANQICEELNVKKVAPHDPAQGPMLRPEVKLSMKTAGPKFGPRVKEVQTALAMADPAWVAGMVQARLSFELPCPNGAVTVDPADVEVRLRPPDGWAGVADRGTQVLVDTRITEDLAREGMARDVVRQVQELRKKSGLEMEDRIALHLQTESAKLRKAIEAHRAYICAETLATQWASQPLDGDAHQASAKVDGQALRVMLRKA
jgi:isoleucyl-tRNA synthetase